MISSKRRQFQSNDPMFSLQIDRMEMYPLRLTINDSFDFDRIKSIDDKPSEEHSSRTFLFYFGLPNSTIPNIDDDNLSMTTTSESNMTIESDRETSSNHS